jgi:hypothetical protein
VSGITISGERSQPARSGASDELSALNPGTVSSSGGMCPSPVRAGPLGFFIVSSFMLSWVAFYNGAPLVFSDTIAYAAAALRGEMPGLFSFYYSLFILPFHGGTTLWPVVFVQGAIAAHLIYVFTRCVLDGATTHFEVCLIVAGLSLFSSLPWITGQVMPDAFSPVVLLNMFLLAFCAKQLSRGEVVYIEALTALAIASHFSHMPIAAGLIVLCILLRMMIPAPDAASMRQTAIVLVMPLVVAIAAILAANWIDSRQFILARNSNVFLLAKLLDEGPAVSYLDQACPEARYSLCSHLEQVRGMTHDDLKWSADSPFYKLGGFDEFEPEARSIVWATLRAYPLDILRRAVLDSGRQLVRFETGDGLKAAFAKMVGDHLSSVFGADIRTSLYQSKQGQSLLPLWEARLVHSLALGCSVVYCLWSLVQSRRFLTKRLLAFHFFVPGAVVWSAIVTGALSGPYDRYLARVIWIVVLLCLLSCIWRLRERALSIDPAPTASDVIDLGRGH